MVPQLTRCSMARMQCPADVKHAPGEHSRKIPAEHNSGGIVDPKMRQYQARPLVKSFPEVIPRFPAFARL